MGREFSEIRGRLTRMARYPFCALSVTVSCFIYLFLFYFIAPIWAMSGCQTSTTDNTSDYVRSTRTENRSRYHLNMDNVVIPPSRSSEPPYG
jgi:hypothetical protein